MRVYVYSSGYNCEQYAKQCIDSVKAQTYKNWCHVIVDDCSTDTTYKICQEQKESRNTIIKTPTNQKWTKNAVEYCKPLDSDIVICLDLDDWLYDSAVLEKVVGYHKQGKWLTYGQYQRASNNAKGHCLPYPNHILANRNFRRHSFIASHLRTYRGFLWNGINKEHLKDQTGKYVDMGSDVGIMMPMLEMCDLNKIQFIDDILYVYNDLNPLNDHKKDRALQKAVEHWFRSLSKYPVLHRSD